MTTRRTTRRTFSDTNPYQGPTYTRDISYSSNTIIVSEDAVSKFDKDAEYYDMSGEKYLIILNQHTFKWSKHFGNRRPRTRFYTNNDVKHLKKVFKNLGFKVQVARNLRYKYIMKYLQEFASKNHTDTSCICVTILSHGDKGNWIYAADQPYLLNEVITIFDEQPSLLNKPKLFFVQACRGENEDPGFSVYLDRPDGMPTMPPVDEGLYGCCYNLMDLLRNCACSRVDGEPNPSTVPLLTVPTHADILVLYSSFEDYRSYRDQRGSWMIRALCDTIKKYHEHEHLMSMITTMNRMVAYENITYVPSNMAKSNKKQMPETRLTLTKNLKFSSSPTTQLISSVSFVTRL